MLNTAVDIHIQDNGQIICKNLGQSRYSLYHHNSVASWFQFSRFLGYNSQYESAIVPMTTILTKFVKFNKECILLLKTSKD